jgi:CDP-diacylglycerol pyrophosphatase
MADETLVVVGALFADGDAGFILLADHADPASGDTGHGEDLQDHACALAATLP